jgi:hypothetical protein
MVSRVVSVDMWEQHVSKTVKDFPANIEKYGLKDIQLRKEYFRQKAATAQSKANEYSSLADKLDKMATEVNKLQFKLGAAGKTRLDGKTAKALIKRDLEATCGIVHEPTKLHVRKNLVEAQNVYWAEAWVGEMVKGMKDAGFSAQARTAFYNTVAQYKGDPDSVQAEAGLLILEKQ